jgi:hypothetical protein
MSVKGPDGGIVSLGDNPPPPAAAPAAVARQKFDLNAAVTAFSGRANSGVTPLFGTVVEFNKGDPSEFGYSHHGDSYVILTAAGHRQNVDPSDLVHHTKWLKEEGHMTIMEDAIHQELEQRLQNGEVLSDILLEIEGGSDMQQAKYGHADVLSSFSPEDIKNYVKSNDVLNQLANPEIGQRAGEFTVGNDTFEVSNPDGEVMFVGDPINPMIGRMGLQHLGTKADGSDTTWALYDGDGHVLQGNISHDEMRNRDNYFTGPGREADPNQTNFDWQSDYWDDLDMEPILHDSSYGSGAVANPNANDNSILTKEEITDEAQRAYDESQANAEDVQDEILGGMGGAGRILGGDEIPGGGLGGTINDLQQQVNPGNLVIVRDIAGQPISGRVQDYDHGLHGAPVAPSGGGGGGSSLLEVPP